MGVLPYARKRGIKMDIIHIKNLEVFANHGVFEEENTLGQKFVINADLYTDFSNAVGKMVFNKGLRHAGYDTDGLELFEEGLCPAGYTPAVCAGFSGHIGTPGRSCRNSAQSPCEEDRDSARSGHSYLGP